MHYMATRISSAQATILATRLQRRARVLRDERGDAAELQEVEAALDRVKAGAYGLCIECGEPLPLARLGVLPQATLCMECESARASASAGANASAAPPPF